MASKDASLEAFEMLGVGEDLNLRRPQLNTICKVQILRHADGFCPCKRPTSKGQLGRHCYGETQGRLRGIESLFSVVYRERDFFFFNTI